MAQYIDKANVQKAMEMATNTFNSLPYETRSKLANGYERLLEVELLLSKGDKLLTHILIKSNKNIIDFMTKIVIF